MFGRLPRQDERARLSRWSKWWGRGFTSAQQLYTPYGPESSELTVDGSSPTMIYVHIKCISTINRMQMLHFCSRIGMINGFHGFQFAKPEREHTEKTYYVRGTPDHMPNLTSQHVVYDAALCHVLLHTHRNMVLVIISNRCVL